MTYQELFPDLLLLGGQVVSFQLGKLLFYFFHLDRITFLTFL